MDDGHSTTTSFVKEVLEIKENLHIIAFWCQSQRAYNFFFLGKKKNNFFDRVEDCDSIKVSFVRLFFFFVNLHLIWLTFDKYLAKVKWKTAWIPQMTKFD